MSDIKGTETEKNLMKAFEGESKARNKYTFYALQAKKEGYDYISRVFEETANNEKEHAKIWFKWLNNNEFPHTSDNLLEAAQGEHFESSEMYAEFAKKAVEEGFEHIASLFLRIAQIEQSHEERFKKLLLSIKDDVKPDGKGNYMWECSECGCTLEQQDKPEFCPLCANEDIFWFKRPK